MIPIPLRKVESVCTAERGFTCGIRWKVLSLLGVLTGLHDKMSTSARSGRGSGVPAMVELPLARHAGEGASARKPVKPVSAKHGQGAGRFRVETQPKFQRSSPRKRGPMGGCRHQQLWLQERSMGPRFRGDEMRCWGSAMFPHAPPQRQARSSHPRRPRPSCGGENPCRPPTGPRSAHGSSHTM